MWSDELMSSFEKTKNQQLYHRLMMMMSNYIIIIIFVFFVFLKLFLVIKIELSSSSIEWIPYHSYFYYYYYYYLIIVEWIVLIVIMMVKWKWYNFLWVERKYISNFREICINLIGKGTRINPRPNTFIGGAFHWSMCEGSSTSFLLLLLGLLTLWFAAPWRCCTELVVADN